MLTSATQGFTRDFIWRWRRGFKATTKTFYNLAHGANGDYRNYLPDAASRDLAMTNGQFVRDILNDKLLFAQLFSDLLAVPKNLAFIARGEVFALTEATVHSAESLLAYAEAYPLILKPSLGQKGRGVLSLRYDAGQFYLDQDVTSPEAIVRQLGQLDGYLVTPWVQPAPYAATIFPQAGNSIRVITLRDPDDAHRSFVAAAFHKFGTGVSAPTDNWARGGLIAPMDVMTGRLGAGLEELVRNRGQPVTHDTHPETGARIEGVQVPGWQTVHEQLLTMLEHVPYFQYVGWDVLLTETGFSVLEGNTTPAIVSLQLTRPLLDDPRVSRFVAHHRIKVPGLQKNLKLGSRSNGVE